MIKAEDARELSQFHRRKLTDLKVRQGKSKKVCKGPSDLRRIESRVKVATSKGQSHATGFTTRETRRYLKSKGFRVYSILSITLIRW